MNKAMWAMLVVAAVAVVAPSRAHARDMDGRFGVGLEENLAGATGLAVRYFTSDSVALLATLGELDAAIASGRAPGPLRPLEPHALDAVPGTLERLERMAESLAVLHGAISRWLSRDRG